MDFARRGLYDLNGIIDLLAKNNDLIRVKTMVDPKFELAGIAQKLEGGKVVLFEATKGFKAPVLTGLLWNREVLARIFKTTPEQLPFLIADAISRWQTRPVAPVVVERAPANEVVEKVPDLNELPIPVHALKDGGRYIDCGVFIAKDPDTGVRNASIHRCLIVGKDKMTVELDLGRHIRDYYERAEARGNSLPLTISIGVGLDVYISAITPSAAAPIETDELGIASEILGEPLKLVKAKTVPVEGVAYAQYIIEGEMLPKVRYWEGPFAEVTGYYARREKRHVVKVRAITRRKNPIFHTVLSGKEVYNSVGLLGEAAVFRLISKLVPGITGVYFSHGGCGFYHAIVRMKKGREGAAKNAILATFAAFPSLKMVTVVDDDVDIYNAEDVEWALATRLNPETGIIFVRDAICHELNPSTKGGLGTKIGFDATCPFPKDETYERAKCMEVNLSRYLMEGWGQAPAPPRVERPLKVTKKKGGPPAPWAVM